MQRIFGFDWESGYIDRLIECACVWKRGRKPLYDNGRSPRLKLFLLVNEAASKVRAAAWKQGPLVMNVWITERASAMV